MTIVNTNDAKFQEMVADLIDDAMGDGIEMAIVVIQESRKLIMDGASKFKTEDYYNGVMDTYNALEDVLQNSKMKLHKREIS